MPLNRTNVSGVPEGRAAYISTAPHDRDLLDEREMKAGATSLDELAQRFNVTRQATAERLGDLSWSYSADLVRLQIAEAWLLYARVALEESGANMLEDQARMKTTL